ncbi:MAG: folylpolyglutamate synthase/dihydrofolate synthase family protein [Blastochloris sp.]|nr:folylpolyglutamate synthase/dihydrofolate synthase family protein [Blastochloris sp.]
MPQDDESGAMTYQQCVDYLCGLHRFGIRLGLETMRALCLALGNPEKELCFVHIAGTNGKGSTAAFLESICRHAGLRTGLYTSPHLVDFSERIRVAGVPIGREDVVRYTLKIRALIHEQEDLKNVSFFEFTTAMALLFFIEQKTEIVIWETGLGGRLDATNVVEPECCIITQIGWDHMDYLGNTLGEIAAEKAGILKTSKPLILAGDPTSEAGLVIRKQAEKLGCQVFYPRQDIEGVHLGLRGEYQKENAHLALETCSVLEGLGWTIPMQARREGLEQVTWPGRFQILGQNPNWVLDGAHNAAGIQTALAAWRAEFGTEPEQILFSCVADKDVEAMVHFLDRDDFLVHLVPLLTKRTVQPEQMQTLFQNARIRCHMTVPEALMEAKNDGRSLLIVGSLYLAGEVLAHLHDKAHELGLNG